MKEKTSYSKLALDAMLRASKEAAERAAEKNLKIPVWKDGKIVFLEPKEKLLHLDKLYLSL